MIKTFVDACSGGKLNLTKACYDKMKDEYDFCEMYEDYGYDVITSGLIAAARDGHIEIFKYLVEEFPLKDETKKKMTINIEPILYALVHPYYCLSLCREEKKDNLIQMFTYIVGVCGSDINYQSFIDSDCIHSFCKKNQLFLLQYTINKYPEIVNHLNEGSKYEKDTTPLWNACQYGNFEIAKYLCENYMDKIDITKRIRSSTYFHAFVNSNEILRYMIPKFKDKIDINVVDEYGLTAIAHAASYLQTENVILICETYGHDNVCIEIISKSSKDEISFSMNHLIPIDFKCIRIVNTGKIDGHLKFTVLNLIFTKINFLTIRDSQHIQLQVNKLLKCIKYICHHYKHKIDINQPDINGSTVFGNLCKLMAMLMMNYHDDESFKKEVLQQIVKDIYETLDYLQNTFKDQKININLYSSKYRFLINYLCDAEIVDINLNLIKYLCESPFLETIDFNLSSKNDAMGCPLLHFVCQYGHIETAKYLCKKYSNVIDVNIKHDFEHTPLHIACANNHFEIVKCLCEHFEDEIGITDDGHDGKSTLAYACKSGAFEIIKYLCEKYKEKIDINKRDNSNEHCMHYLCKHNDFEIIKYLNETFKEEINFNLACNLGCTPIHVACLNGFTEIVKYLCENTNTDVNKIIENSHETPLFIACETGYKEIVKYLCENKEKLNLNIE